MRGQRQRHLVKANINIRLMIDFQGLFGDSPHKINARHESYKFKCAANGLRAFRPIRNGFQLKIDFFGGQGWHNGKSILVPTGAAPIAAAGTFVDAGPSAGFTVFTPTPFISWPASMCAACRFCLSVQLDLSP